jgi:hypothetical protein
VETLFERDDLAQNTVSSPIPTNFVRRNAARSRMAIGSALV